MRGRVRMLIGLALCGACQTEKGTGEVDTVPQSASKSEPTRQDCRRSGVVAQRMVADGAVLLDVRTQDEWNEGHLEGATHAPVDELSGRLKELPIDKSVVTYCRSGGRAERAATTLREAGYDVYVLGGMSDWDAPGDCESR